MESTARVYFVANACHVCKSKTTICRCEICRMIFYCSEEHRRFDWFDHSEICWAINKICESENCHHLWELHNGENLTGFKHGVAKKCTELLKRSLKLWEFEMIYHPRMCSVCGEFDWRKLSFCERCEFVYCCEKRHFPKNHSKWCDVMKIYSELIIKNNIRSVSADFNRFQIANNNFKSMSDVILNNSQNLIQSESFEIEKVLLSELLTYPLTVLNVFSKKIISIGKKNLEILFIGAENQAEVEPLDKWEKYFFHLLEDVENLNLKFLGPELRTDFQKWSGNLCDACRKRGRNLKFECISGKFYHEYATEENCKPDLICAFNSGMYRDFGFGNENSWKKTIEKLFANGNPPVLITEYTLQEMKMVLQKINNICGDVGAIIRVEMNPFASLKPGLNIISENETPVIFKNYFHSLLQKK